MGIYLNPGNKAFRFALNDYVYVDKTGLISYVNDRLGRASKYICVSRPRRFGKSMAADMLVAYYSRGCESGELFSGLKIGTDPSYEEHLNRHNVVRIDVQLFLDVLQSDEALVERISAAVIKELKKDFPECRDMDNGAGLQAVLNEVYLHTGEGFIFVIDEWDCVFRITKEKEKIQKKYLDFLRNLFKGTVYVDLVYMTGILPIKKYGEHSALNMFTEYSITSPKDIGEYYGFTREEVQAECAARGVDYEQMEKWYDGYLVGGTHIYNPKSVNDALMWRSYESYWTGTETYEALKVYIDRDYDGLKEAIVGMIGGRPCEVDTGSFQNDMTTFNSKDDVLTLLVHLGYLTYDNCTGCVSIPNMEVSQEFVRAVKNSREWDELNKAINQSLKLLKATWEMDSEAVARGIEKAHSEVASYFKYHDENSLACVVRIAYYSAIRYYMNPVSEFPSGKGRADIVYLPLKGSGRPALIIELKWNKEAMSAIEQIKERRYASWIEGYTGEVLLVGISYDPKTKAHECVIERYVKEGY